MIPESVRAKLLKDKLLYERKKTALDALVTLFLRETHELNELRWQYHTHARELGYCLRCDGPLDICRCIPIGSVGMAHPHEPYPWECPNTVGVQATSLGIFRGTNYESGTLNAVGEFVPDLPEG